jgi:hypothetical protein
MERPKSLTVTREEWARLLTDPVLAAWVFFGVTLDVFQRARLRYFWWVHNVMDSSGWSSGKTIVDWIFANLRCLLIPDQEVGVYYPVFQTGKDTFWRYYKHFLGRSRLFRSQMGRTDELGEDDGDGQSEGAACYKAYFRNGNVLYMPAPSFMKEANTQASRRFNTLIVEEWTHIDATSTGIDDQLIGRVTRPCWNQHHPIWGNHILFTAPAKSRMHPGAKRHKAYEREVRKGNPQYATLSYSYKDYSNLDCGDGRSFQEAYRIESTIAELRAKKGKGDFMGEGFGIWAALGQGWFTEEMLLRAVALGVGRGVQPVLSRREWEHLAK